jgi:hypothetical protein
MDSQTARLDPLERYRAATQFDQIMLANRDRGWAACRDAMVEWHLSAVTTVRADSTVARGRPGRDPAVEEAIIRFYQYQVRLTMDRLKDENLELRRQQFETIAAIGARLLKARPTDKQALAVVEGLQSLPG